MLPKDAYAERLLMQMRDLRLDLDALKAKANEKESADSKVTEVLYELEEKFSAVEDRLYELQEAKGTSWTQMKKSVDRAWEEAFFAIDSVKGELLQ